MNNEPVMFEWPVGSGNYWDTDKSLICLEDYAYSRYEDYKIDITLLQDGKSDVKYQYTKSTLPSHFANPKESSKSIEYEQHKAIFKSQGWLSPEDQKPFCMESAQYGYFSKNLRKQYKAFYYNDDGKLDRTFDACGKWLAYDDYYIEKPQAFMPINEFGLIDHPETARLDALGVKRYEQGGGE